VGAARRQPEEQAAAEQSPTNRASHTGTMRGISLTVFQSDFRLSGNIPVVALIVKKQTTEVAWHQEIDGTYKLTGAAGLSTEDAEALSID
jgi:hypothetical protein